eukprot:1475940-Pyramimonas_sp.AAC.2
MFPSNTAAAQPPLIDLFPPMIMGVVINYRPNHAKGGAYRSILWVATEKDTLVTDNHEGKTLPTTSLVCISGGRVQSVAMSTTTRAAQYVIVVRDVINIPLFMWWVTNR